MLIGFIKFIHLLCAISLVGSTFVCLLLVGSRKFGLTPLATRDSITRLNIFMFLLSLVVLVTGTFLVLPRHFSFHTPWIIAAYLLILIYFISIAALMLFKKKRLVKNAGEKIPKSQQYLWRAAYVLLMILLILIVHDAVTKTTLFA